MSFYEDETDTLAGQNMYFSEPSKKNGMVIQFYHVATVKKSLDKKVPNGSQATFKAFLNTFKDNFKVSWNQKETLGRMDAIQTFKNTQRSINIGFDVPSNSIEEAVSNFIELEKLIMMQYPVYETIAGGAAVKSTGSPNVSESTTGNTERDLAAVTANNASTQVLEKTSKGGRFMSAPPFLYIKFVNWIASNKQVEQQSGFNDCLVGTINEVSFEPDLEQGVHFVDNKLIPKLFTINLNINIIHTQELGWTNVVSNTNEQLGTHVFGEPTSQTGEQGFDSYPVYPYGVERFVYKKITESE